jgi:glucose/arabinose dehydrogenase
VLALEGSEPTTLASGLAEPRGVAITDEGTCLVAESGAGRVVQLAAGRAETLLEGLEAPHGLAVRGDRLYVVDAGAKSVIEFDRRTGERTTIAADLPIGPPPGVVPKPLLGLKPFAGPLRPFAGLAAAPDGTLYLAADGDGSILALRRGQAQ